MRDQKRRPVEGDERETLSAAQALRDVASALPDLTQGAMRVGTACWPADRRDAYSLAVEEAQAALRARADEIGAGYRRHDDGPRDVQAWAAEYFGSLDAAPADLLAALGGWRSVSGPTTAGGEATPLAVRRRPQRPTDESLDPIVYTLISEREQRGLSGRDVTRAIGGSASDLSRWERGLGEPSLRRLRQWAASLGYDVVLQPSSRPGKDGDR